MRLSTLHKYRSGKTGSPARRKQAEKAVRETVRSLRGKPRLAARLLYENGRDRREAARLLCVPVSTIAGYEAPFLSAWERAAPRYRSVRTGAQAALDAFRRAAPEERKRLAVTRRFGHALGKLPERMRTPLLLRYRGNKSWQETAKLTGYSVSGLLKMNARLTALMKP